MPGVIDGRRCERRDKRTKAARGLGQTGLASETNTRSERGSRSGHNELSNRPLLSGLYQGDAEKVRIERASPRLVALFGAYQHAYGSACPESLPPGKVEITRSICVREQYPVNVYGTRVGPSTCIEYEQVGTGVYADPELYQVKQRLDRPALGDAFSEALKLITTDNPLGGAIDLNRDIESYKEDMNSLMKLNPCGGGALKHFEKNLVLFADGKQLLAANPSGAANPAPPTPAEPFRDSNYQRLVEDLVSEHSKTWVFNRFESGSVSDAVVARRDTQGRPLRIDARYGFAGFNGRTVGAVNVTFADGRPECLYYFDFPTTCRTVMAVSQRRMKTGAIANVNESGGTIQCFECFAVAFWLGLPLPKMLRLRVFGAAKGPSEILLLVGQSRWISGVAAKLRR